MLRKTPLKKSTAPLKKGKGLAKQSPKYKEGKQERIEHGQAIIDCFRRVAVDRMQGDGVYRWWLCEETGQRIPHLSTLNMHHLLHKSKYPEYADQDWNIMIITQESHTLAHSDPDKVPNVKARTEELYQKHVNKEL